MGCESTPGATQQMGRAWPERVSERPGGPTRPNDREDLGRLQALRRVQRGAAGQAQVDSGGTILGGDRPEQRPCAASSPGRCLNFRNGHAHATGNIYPAQRGVQSQPQIPPCRPAAFC